MAIDTCAYNHKCWWAEALSVHVVVKHGAVSYDFDVLCIDALVLVLLLAQCLGATRVDLEPLLKLQRQVPDLLGHWL